jgi:hypothetical protein
VHFIYKERIRGTRGLKWSDPERDILMFDLPWPEELFISLGE